MNTLINKLIAVVFICILPVISMAADERLNAGRIEHVESDHHAIIVDDQYYLLSLSLKIWDKNKQKTSRYELETGKNVLFRAHRSANGQAVMDEIWLDHQAPSGDED